MEYLEHLIQQGNFAGAFIMLLVSGLISIGFIVVEILIIKYFIRYGINYYFKKLTEHEMKYQIDDIGYDVMTHKEDE